MLCVPHTVSVVYSSSIFLNDTLKKCKNHSLLANYSKTRLASSDIDFPFDMCKEITDNIENSRRVLE